MFSIHQLEDWTRAKPDDQTFRGVLLREAPGEPQKPQCLSVSHSGTPREREIVASKVMSSLNCLELFSSGGEVTRLGSGPTSVSKMVGVGLGGLTTEPEDMVGALG